LTVQAEKAFGFEEKVSVFRMVPPLQTPRRDVIPENMERQHARKTSGCAQKKGRTREGRKGRDALESNIPGGVVEGGDSIRNLGDGEGEGERGCGGGKRNCRGNTKSRYASRSAADITIIRLGKGKKQS